MLPHLHRFLCSLAVVALAVGLCPARADDADAVKERLFQAKKTYDGETQKFRNGVAEWLDKREDAARTLGDKKLVDQVKTERAGFEKTGELPSAPPAVLKPLTTARADLDKAYQAGVKDYIRLKEDAAADAVEKEREEFLFASAFTGGKRTYLATLKHYDVKVGGNTFFSNNGTIQGQKIKVGGELVPHSIYMEPPTKSTGQAKYPLAGRWIAFKATVGVPTVADTKQAPFSALTFEVLGDGKSLWKSNPVKKLDEFQTCTVNVQKVRVLTLHVHCPDKSDWGRAVWFEPILAE